MNRRTMIGAIALLLGSVGTGFAGLFAWVVQSARPRSRSNSRWVALCRTDEVGKEPKKFTYSFQRLDGWYLETVTRHVYASRPDGQIQVFSRRCTHLGCPVLWNKKSESYRCPCHGAVFARDGSVQEGPPPRPLDTVAHRVAGDVLEVEEV